MHDVVERAHQLYGSILPADQMDVLESGPSELELGQPVLMVAPDSEEQTAETLRLAYAEGLRVVPIGSGSAMHLGNLPAHADVLVSTARLDRTMIYEPRDLTVVVQAGRRLSSLQGEVGKEGQMLALDPPNLGRTTIGGMLSTNSSGPLRRAFGAPRDLCLGMRAVLADGTVIKGGGRVVKNVAGYDLCRLFVGSNGTLGVLVEAAFRLHPIPAHGAGVVGVYASWEAATDAAHRLTHSELQPAILEVLDLGDGVWGDDHEDRSAPSVLITFRDVRESVAYQAERAAAMVREAGSDRVVEVDSDKAGLWHGRVRELLDEAHHGPNAVVCRVGTVMTSVLAAIQMGLQLAGSAGLGVQSVAHYTDGVVYTILRLPEVYVAEQVADVVDRFRKEMLAFGGRLVVESAPCDVKRLVDVWGEPTGPLSIMQRLKDRMDPHHLLNRGRFVRDLEVVA